MARAFSPLRVELQGGEAGSLCGAITTTTTKTTNRPGPGAPATRRGGFPKQATRIVIAAVAAALALVGGFGWWAATRIDDEALERQVRALAMAIGEVADAVVVEQDSSAIWDDAVLNLRANNEAWLAENLADWLSSYYGHDRVYLLNARNQLVRAVHDGEPVGPDAFEADRPALQPLVDELRTEMQQASAGEEDSTAAITGFGALDRVVLGDGKVAIASVRPVVPGGDGTLTQAPGTEFLHISLRVLDADVDAAVGEKFGLTGLRFETQPTKGGGLASYPVMDNAGRILGFYRWQPHRPASQLLAQTGPAMAVLGLLVAVLVGLLLRRLKRTSTRLEISEANATFLAFHDPLTRLPNRALFEDRLDRALVSLRHSGTRFALHSIDLDRFKQVNDSLGHPVGDELMRQVTLRLLGLASEVDTVARLGGDEFALLQADVPTPAQAIPMSERIVETLAQPFDLLGHHVQIGGSVGLVHVDAAGLSADDVLRRADVALYGAKAAGRGRYQLFAGELDLAVQERRSLELELRAAIAGAPGLELVYQPIFEARSSRVAGAEALVRWNNPRLGRLSPAMFIGLAEERGLIEQLGQWVLREACDFASRNPALRWVAVNVSPIQVQHEHFAERVLSVLAETGLPPSRLELEITEGLLLQNSSSVQDSLNRLRAAGIRVALDDFGTGYSSISYLRSHGVDKLKIDQSFVAKLGKDLEIHHIVRCIIELARAMHMSVTAEGVETEEQKTILQNLACTQLQGYLLSRPLSPEAMQQLLSDSSTQDARVA